MVGIAPGGAGVVPTDALVPVEVSVIRTPFEGVPDRGVTAVRLHSQGSLHCDDVSPGRNVRGNGTPRDKRPPGRLVDAGSPRNTPASRCTRRLPTRKG